MLAHLHSFLDTFPQHSLTPPAAEAATKQASLTAETVETDARRGRGRSRDVERVKRRSGRASRGQKVGQMRGSGGQDKSRRDKKDADNELLVLTMHRSGVKCIFEVWPPLPQL